MRFESTFRSIRSAPGEARELIRARIGARVPAPTLADTLTVVSELVENGVIHGQGEEVRVCIEVLPDKVIGEVQNDGYAEIKHVEPDPRSLRGLGLHIVAAVASNWRTKYGVGTTAVRFEVWYA